VLDIRSPSHGELDFGADEHILLAKAARRKWNVTEVHLLFDVGVAVDAGRRAAGRTSRDFGEV
jgi:hypothetical protein